MNKNLFAAGILLGLSLTARAESNGPWDMAALSKVPHATWGEAKEPIREVYYEGETFKVKPTRVFAYYGKPAGTGPLPGIVLAHGGGGAAFRDWVKHWVDNYFAKMPDDLRMRWIENFEPSRYLGQAQCPMLFMNGTSDFAYPLESYQKSYNLVKSPVTLCIQINRGHGHIWTFPEVDAFIDSYLKMGAPLLKIGPMTVAGEKASAVMTGTGTVANAQLDYAIGPDRVWKSLPAEIKGKAVSVNLPAERPLIGYFYVTDQRGLAISKAAC
ncbi:MAG: hypothetical protein NTW21_01860 [Verrucomicrobia bacterium]|nr:hypothetical protein [Verrucomicrobiota bacterium]